MTFAHTIRTTWGIRALSLAQVISFKTIGELQAYLGVAYTAANADRIRLLVELWNYIQRCKQAGLIN